MIKERARRHGPGWAEILFSLACSMLTATDVLYGRSSNLPQSAESYYFAYPAVQTFHFLAVSINCLVVALTLFWIVFPVTGKAMKVGVIAMALAGIALCWAEVVYAAKLDSGQVFNLTNLPYRPIGNSGVLGAQVFGAYLLLKLPSGKLSEAQAALLKIGLAACLYVLQLLVWDGVRRVAGLDA